MSISRLMQPKFGIPKYQTMLTFVGDGMKKIGEEENFERLTQRKTKVSRRVCMV